nr:poly [ADP-ribose] polymerase 3-like [Penaeus vannamei]
MLSVDIRAPPTKRRRGVRQAVPESGRHPPEERGRSRFLEERRVDVFLKQKHPRAKVHQDYSCLLVYANVRKSMNRFYIIQIIRLTKKYICFTRWGRVGERGTWFEYDGTDEANAVKNFKEIFKSKTRNSWERRHAFRSYYRQKYTWIEIDEKAEEGGVSCNLDPGTCKLVRLIHAKEILCNNNREDNRLPCKDRLGRVVAGDGEVDVRISRVLGLSSKIFPIGHGRHLRSTREILLEFSKAKDTLTPAVHPTRVLYDQLECDLQLVCKNSPEYKLIREYATASKSTYRRRIVNLWRVNRKGEKERFAPHAGLPNRKLLWHGTKPWCVGRILREGLRLLPHSEGASGGDSTSPPSTRRAPSTPPPATSRAREQSPSCSWSRWLSGLRFETGQSDSSLRRAPAGYGSVVGRGRTEPGGTRSVEVARWSPSSRQLSEYYTRDAKPSASGRSSKQNHRFFTALLGRRLTMAAESAVRTMPIYYRSLDLVAKKCHDEKTLF